MDRMPALLAVETAPPPVPHVPICRLQSREVQRPARHRVVGGAGRELLPVLRENVLHDAEVVVDVLQAAGVLQIKGGKARGSEASRGKRARA